MCCAAQRRSAPRCSARQALDLASKVWSMKTMTTKDAGQRARNLHIMFLISCVDACQGTHASTCCDPCASQPPLATGSQFATRNAQRTRTARRHTEAGAECVASRWRRDPHASAPQSWRCMIGIIAAQAGLESLRVLACAWARRRWVKMLAAHKNTKEECVVDMIRRIQRRATRCQKVGGGSRLFLRGRPLAYGRARKPREACAPAPGPARP